MGIENAFISINTKNSERKQRMLEKSIGISALMIALVTGNVIWGGTAVHAGTKSSIYVRYNGSNCNTDRKKRC